MKLLVRDKPLRNTATPLDRKARKAALKVLEAGLEAADPARCIRAHVRREGGHITFGRETLNLEDYERIFVVGGGKASGIMATALEAILGDHITDGSVNVLKGTAKRFKTKQVAISEANHPLPDENGVEGTKRIVALAEEAGRRDLVVALISGGGSALMTLPAENLPLNDIQNLTNMLLRSGATIREVNIVRKHLSKIKGGHLAAHVYPATLITLIISDVAGDPLDMIASGPTVPDPTAYSQAIQVLKKHKIWSKTAKSIKNHLSAGQRGLKAETPKGDGAVFARTRNIIIGNNTDSCLAALTKAQELGFNTVFLSSRLEGEARHVGTALASIVMEAITSGNPTPRPVIILAGGETTVEVSGRGKGGRNQELVLSASASIKGGRGVAVASIGTDGIDGPTDATGAIVDGSTFQRGLDLGVNPEDMLRENDSYRFFQKVGGHIVTGPTYTNVNDLTVLVAV